MRKFQPIKQWGVLLKDRQYVLSLVSGFVVIIVALFANFVASQYVSSIQASSVNDLILDYLPTIDLNFFYVTGITVIIGGIAFYSLLFRPELAPFTLKTYALFVIIRSFFISLTHIGPPLDFFKYAGPAADTPILVSFYFSNDLFFSAHTGIPFLAFLLFHKENRIVGYFFLAGSIMMAITVLLMHVHYSIDVFAAYFITYSIYKFSEWIFYRLNYQFQVRVRLLYEKSKKHRRKLLKKLKKLDFRR